jgi:hypothetical protein
LSEVKAMCLGNFVQFWNRSLAGKWALILLGISILVGCREKQQTTTTEIVASRVERLPAQPDDPVWQRVPEYVGKLLLQDIVEPRQLKATTTELRVRAVQNGKLVAFRLEWMDPTRDDVPGPGRFSDACALQFPVEAGPTLPAPQMGEPGKPVEILFWSANWQALAEGRPDQLRALYPNAWVDHYPHEAPSLERDSALGKEMAGRYLPARALGNDRGGPRKLPVEEYLAEGPGSLSRARTQASSGTGKRTDKGWSVVLTRGLPKARHVALAVWDGAQGEVGGRKMRTGWIPLRAQEMPPK